MTIDTLLHARPWLIILVAAVLAVLTLRHLRLPGVGSRHRPRRRSQTMLIVLALLFSAALMTGAIGAGDTVDARFLTAARNLGAIDETVASTAGDAQSEPRGLPYFPEATADHLRTGLANAGIAGVSGAMVALVAFQDRATHLSTARVELLGMPTTYPTAFGPLWTIQGTTVTLGQLGADQVYLNQAAAQALGAHAGDRLQPYCAGQTSPARPTTLYFAEGYTGQFRTNGQATFEETLVLDNTAPCPAPATLTYLIQDAAPLVVTRVIPPHATLRESVNRDVGPDRSVAAIVASSARLTARRLLSRLDAQGNVMNATSVPGISTVGTTLSFAPGHLGSANQVYLALANPGPLAAQVSATVTAPAGAETGSSTQSATVPAQGRATLNLGQAMGSLRVTSDEPIVAEEARYTGAGSGSGKRGWTVTMGTSLARGPRWRASQIPPVPAARLYAPVVRAVLRNQNLAAGGLLSGGAQADPLALVPLQQLQQLIGKPNQITMVLVSNRSDPLAGAPLTSQVTGALQTLLVNVAAVTRIKLLLILPSGLNALQALQQDAHLAAGTRAKLQDVQVELGVPGTSARLKSLLGDPTVVAALRTIADPAIADTLQPALSALGAYTVQPVKQDGLARDGRVARAFAARSRTYDVTVLAAGIVLSVLVVVLLPVEERVGKSQSSRRRHRVTQLLGRRYARDVGAALLGVALGSAVGRGAVPFIAARASADAFARQFPHTARGVGVAGLDELVITMPSTLAGALTSTGIPTSIGTATSAGTPTSTSTSVPTPTSTPTSLPTSTSTSAPTSTPLRPGT